MKIKILLICFFFLNKNFTIEQLKGVNEELQSVNFKKFTYFTLFNAPMFYLLGKPIYSNYLSKNEITGKRDILKRIKSFDVFKNFSKDIGINLGKLFLLRKARGVIRENFKNYGNSPVVQKIKDCLLKYEKIYTDKKYLGIDFKELFHIAKLSNKYYPKIAHEVGHAFSYANYKEISDESYTCINIFNHFNFISNNITHAQGVVYLPIDGKNKQLELIIFLLSGVVNEFFYNTENFSPSSDYLGAFHKNALIGDLSIITDPIFDLANKNLINFENLLEIIVKNLFEFFNENSFILKDLINEITKVFEYSYENEQKIKISDLIKFNYDILNDLFYINLINSHEHLKKIADKELDIITKQQLNLLEEKLDSSKIINKEIMKHLNKFKYGAYIYNFEGKKPIEEMIHNPKANHRDFYFLVYDKYMQNVETRKNFKTLLEKINEEIRKTEKNINNDYNNDFIEKNINFFYDHKKITAAQILSAGEETLVSGITFLTSTILGINYLKKDIDKKKKLMEKDFTYKKYFINLLKSI